MRRRSVIGLVSLTLAVTAAASCGDVVRTGRSPVMMVVNQISGGLNPKAFLLSDVLGEPACVPATTPPTTCPTIFNDPGTATLGLLSKDVSLSPTTNNQVRVTRYHVEYTRSDGHNTPGIDVPFGFDAAVAATIPEGGTATVGFELVRIAAKKENPLVNLRSTANFISTTATVTFFGVDQVGNDVSATGSMLVEFGNFADTQ